MQEFRHENMDMTEQHFTLAETQDLLHKKMNALQGDMAKKGFTETKRVKIGRNDECPCGSGKKFKKCHLNKCN